MREPILMPTLSDTMETGHLIQWLKQPGDVVKKGDAIAEVETDKAVMEVEVFHDGYLAGPLAAADTDLPVGAVIGYIVDNLERGEDKAEPTQKRSNDTQGAKITASQTIETKAPTPLAVPRASSSDPKTGNTPSSTSFINIPASPYARGLARELGIKLAGLTPGPDGSIRAVQVVAAALGRPEPNLDDGPDYELLTLTPMQRAVANNMIAATTTPVFHVSARLSLQSLSTLAHQEKYSLTLLMARACALTVEAHPRFNAVYTSQGLAQRQQVDVGIAVDVPNGLVTPVLRDVARRPVEVLAEDWSSLKARAMGKTPRLRLAPRDYRGATFYLSNLGMFGMISRFDAVVPVGAAAILAVAATQNGFAEFTLSCDHRVVYGADAARFLETLALLLGEPEGLAQAEP